MEPLIIIIIIFWFELLNYLYCVRCAKIEQDGASSVFSTCSWLAASVTGDNATYIIGSYSESGRKSVVRFRISLFLIDGQYNGVFWSQ